MDPSRYSSRSVLLPTVLSVRFRFGGLEEPFPTSKSINNLIVLRTRFRGSSSADGGGGDDDGGPGVVEVEDSEASVVMYTIP